METWHDRERVRGLFAWIDWETGEDDASRIEGFAGHEHAWTADPAFTFGQFFPGGGFATPSYVFIDVSDMTIFHTQAGYAGTEDRFFEPYLR